MKNTLFIFFILLLMPSLVFAETQYLYNNKTKHTIQDTTKRTKVEILKTLNKQEQEADYQMLTLTTEQETLLTQGKITVIVEDGLLVVKDVIPIVTEKQLAIKELKTYVLSVFPSLTKAGDLTVQMVKDSTLASSIKVGLYEAIVDGDLK